MKTNREFNIGNHIWFILSFDENGEMVGLQEHDHYAGGSLVKSKGKTWEEMFVEKAKGRASGEEYQEKVELAAKEFLTSNLEKFSV